MTSAELLQPMTKASMSRPCRECGAPFELPEFIPALIASMAHVCPECSEKAAERESRRTVEASKAVRSQRRKDMCPLQFLGTEPPKLPCQRGVQAVMRWEYGPKGLLLHGGTGQGKSRCAWLLLRREYEAGRSIASLNSASGLAYGAKFSDSASEAARWIERLTTIDLLLIDDVFKAKLTDSFESAVFTVINQRTERQRPMVVTLNDTGETLIERLSPDRGPAMLRRLREFCEPIAFV
jgi:DNA replication protein DnaC